MFEQILPHQIILLWMTISALTGAVIALIISEGRNWLYILANLFFAGFIGTFVGGIFIALTDALVWELWSLLIPIFVGGITAFLVSAYLRDKIPAPSIKVKPIAMWISVLLIIVLSITSIYPVLPATSSGIQTIPVEDVMLNVGSNSVIAPSTNANFRPRLSGATVRNIDLSSTKLTSLETNPLIPLTINSYHTSIKFPVRFAEDAHEGDYITFKLSFSVPDNSPVDWQKPFWYVICWGDVNGNGQFDGDFGLIISPSETSDIILSEQYFKIPSESGGNEIWTSPPCTYDADGNPMWAMYGTITPAGYYLLPVYFGAPSAWKDDSQYTFANTPEGYKPPYDQVSWQYIGDANSGSITRMEDVGWQPIYKGEVRNVYGKLYCPAGMADTAKDWYLTVIAFDEAYSVSEPVSIHNMHFTVVKPEKPLVNITSDWWIEVSLLGLLGIACILGVKYGKRLI